MATSKLKVPILILLGSTSDRPAMAGCEAVLGELGIGYRLEISSAHRHPDRTRRLARTAERQGYQVIITAAGLAAHISGVVASESLLPVIGVPLAGSPLAGLDALYSMVQMPRGVPVATMALASSGPVNAAIFAAQILAIEDRQVKTRLTRWKAKLARRSSPKRS